MKKYFKYALLIFMLSNFQNLFSQEIFFRNGIGISGYNDPGDGMVFTSEIGWGYQNYFSIVATYTHLHQNNVKKAIYRYYNNESGNELTYTLPEGYSYSELSSSFRLFIYGNLLSVFPNKSLRKWRLNAGIGFGRWQGMSNHYRNESGQVKMLFSETRTGFDLVGRINLAYYWKTWQIGLTGGIDHDGIYEAGAIAFLALNAGIQIPLGAKKNKERI